MGEDKVFVMSGLSSNNIPVLVIEPTEEVQTGVDKLKNPYIPKDGDVIIEFKNKSSVNVIIEELNKILDIFDNH
jgi:hypothetical protein